MTDEYVDSTPVSLPVNSAHAVKQRRSVFSSDYAGLTSSHVMSLPEAMSMGERRSRRAPVIEDSLQLLDDLTNRPVDPLFEDATLLKPRKRSMTVRVASNILTFIICVAVGVGGAVAIQELHKDTRQKVREELASQLTSSLTNSENLEKDVSGLKQQVDTLSDKLDGEENAVTPGDTDALTNATTAVEGPGLQVSLANPRTATSADGAIPRESASESRIKVVTDLDLQNIVAILWNGGAEAISINGVRIGVQSSVRTAGDAILVGVSPIESPYTISAIGNSADLENAMQSASTKSFFASLEQEGIYPAVASKSSIKLSAAGQPDVAYSERKK